MLARTRPWKTYRERSSMLLSHGQKDAQRICHLKTLRRVQVVWSSEHCLLSQLLGDTVSRRLILEHRFRERAARE